MTYLPFLSTPTTAVRQRQIVIHLRRLLLIIIVDPTLVQPLQPGATPSPSRSCGRPTLSVHPHPSTIDQVPPISARPPPLQRPRIQVGVRRFTLRHGNQRVSTFPFSNAICPSLSSTASDPRPKDSSPLVYSIAELLRLSTSPLVGISKESQIIVDDLVAHHVWRRGPQSGTPRSGGRRKSRDVSKLRSLHTSTDDSGHSD